MDLLFTAVAWYLVASGFIGCVALWTHIDGKQKETRRNNADTGSHTAK